jgi:phosphatidylglycerophosphate synthase
LAEAAVAGLSLTGLRPVHLTLANLLAGAGAAGLLIFRPYSPQTCLCAAALVLLAWLCDRMDGPLARHRGTASAAGAWLDSNTDELTDLLWHAAVAYVLVREGGSAGPWMLLAAFAAGKYLFVYGSAAAAGSDARSDRAAVDTTLRPGGGWLGRAVRLYRLPANADVRIHLLVAALASGCLAAELWFVAVYYHVRWAVRYARLVRRLAGEV